MTDRDSSNTDSNSDQLDLLFSEELKLQSFGDNDFGTLLDTPYHDLGAFSHEIRTTPTQQSASAMLDLPSETQTVALTNQDISFSNNEPGLPATRPLGSGLVERTKARTMYVGSC